MNWRRFDKLEKVVWYVWTYSSVLTDVLSSPLSLENGQMLPQKVFCSFLLLFLKKLFKDDKKIICENFE